MKGNHNPLNLNNLSDIREKQLIHMYPPNLNGLNSKIKTDSTIPKKKGKCGCW